KLTYAGCAVGVVADVDPETGRVTLHKVAAGADVGRAVNPALIDGQLVGGVALGIGNTLLESLDYDDRGQLLTGTLMDYALPWADDVPPVIGFYQEVTATTNPLGLRGLGECGNPGLSGAIANAVCDAFRDLGVGITALPVTEEFGALRVDRARAHAVDPDIVPRVHQRGRARQVDDAGLGGVVGRQPVVPGGPRDRRGVDDGPASLAAHDRQRVLHPEERAGQGDGDHAVPALERDLVQESHLGHAGIVDQD